MTLHLGRAAVLADALEASMARLLTLVDALDASRWERIPAPDVWSIGKEVEHVAEGMVLHLWIIRRSLGHPVGSRQPIMERRAMTTDLSPASAAALLRDRLDDAVRLIRSLGDRQLALPTRPLRASAPTVDAAIEGILIGHVDTHRAAIEAKLAALR